MTKPMGVILDSSCPVFEAFVREHGLSHAVLRTDRQSPASGRIIISTILATSGHSMIGGFFVVYKTRVFGGKLDGELRSVWSHFVPAKARMVAVEQHLATVRDTMEAEA